MQWSDIWKIVLCIIASAGGVGAIFVAAIKLASDFIAERLSQKYELKLHKELEKYKSGLDNKIYISKTKFDAEFTLYQQLSKSFFDMVKDITTMIPVGLAKHPLNQEDQERYEKILYDKAVDSTVTAQNILKSNIPFIPKDIYEQYCEILKLCRIQLSVFSARWNVLDFRSKSSKESLDDKDYMRSQAIMNEFEALNATVREYLAKLDVIE